MMNTKPSTFSPISSNAEKNEKLPLIGSKNYYKATNDKDGDSHPLEGDLIDNKSAQEEEEEEEAEEDEGEQREEGNLTSERTSNQNNDQPQLEMDYKQKEAEYIMHIEQLENELQIEKQITKTIQSDPLVDQEVDNLKKELKEKTLKVTQMQLTNQKQQAALASLSKQLESQAEEDLRVHTQGKKSLKKPKVKPSPLGILLSVKDKELNNALTLIDILSKDNSQMKSMIYSSKDYQSKLELIDKEKVRKEQLAQHSKEIQLLTKQLEDHKTCMLITKDYNANVEALQIELKQVKSEHIQLRDKLIEIEGKYKHTPTLPLTTLPKSRIKTKEEVLSANTSIHPLKKPLPLKNSLNTQIGIQLFTAEKKKELEIKFTNADEYEDFLRKINKIESFKSTIEPKHKTELNQIAVKVDELEKLMRELSDKSKDKESRNRIYCFQLNEFKHNQKISQRKWNDLQKQFETISNTAKEKEKEVKLLTHQLNALRKIVKQGHNNAAECEISKYIESIQQEAKGQLDDDSNEEDNNNDIEA